MNKITKKNNLAHALNVREHLPFAVTERVAAGIYVAMHKKQERSQISVIQSTEREFSVREHLSNLSMRIGVSKITQQFCDVRMRKTEAIMKQPRDKFTQYTF